MPTVVISLNCPVADVNAGGALILPRCGQLWSASRVELYSQLNLLPILATWHIVHRMPAMQNAASLLRDLRQQQGRSLRSAAADIGIAPSQLSRLERGQRGLGVEVSERLSEYYGVSSEIISLAQGEVPPDIVRIFQQHPAEIERLRAQYGSGATR